MLAAVVLVSVGVPLLEVMTPVEAPEIEATVSEFPARSSVAFIVTLLALGMLVVDPSRKVPELTVVDEP